MLTLDPDHRFWSDPELPYPAERGDFVRVITAPRFVLRGVDGEVELLNAGSQVSRGNARRYGPWKWSKVAYRTGVGFLVSDDLHAYPYDAVLTAERKNGQRFGRHPTIPLTARDDHLAYTYALGTRDDGFNLPVRTDVFWNAGWILAIHRVQSFEPVRYAHGSYALGLEEGDQGLYKTMGDNYILLGSAERYSAIQSLKMLHESMTGTREEGEARRHLSQPYHATPVMRSGWESGEDVIAVLFWAGNKKEHGQPWDPVQLKEGRWQLDHPVLGNWEIRHPSLPALD